MAWQIEYRVALLNVAVPAVPVPVEVIGYVQSTTVALVLTGFLFAVGTNFITENITTYSKAVSIASSGVRRLTALGTDVVAVILGMPIGSDDPATTSPLPAAAQLEQQYGLLDVPSRDLKRAVRVASKPPALGAQYGTDFKSDIAGNTYQA